MMSFNVFGGVSVQVVEDKLVWVHCSHQRVRCLQETEDCQVENSSPPQGGKGQLLCPIVLILGFILTL